MVVIVGTWQFTGRSLGFGAHEFSEFGQPLRIIAVRPRRVDETTFLREIESMRAVQQRAQRTVEVDVVAEPEGTPEVVKGKPGAARGELITALLCEPHATQGYTVHEPRFAFAGFDVLVVVKRNGAPDAIWRHWIDHIIERGATQVRVLLAD